MRLSSLALPLILLSSSTMLAQRSAAPSAGSSGGGTHSSPSVAPSSAGSHNSSSSVSSGHSSASPASPAVPSGHSTSVPSVRGSAAHGSNGGAIPMQNRLRDDHSNAIRSLRGELNAGSQGNLEARPAQPEKRTFFSFLRHPFKRPQPQPVAHLRHRICLDARCQVCPPGQRQAGGGCVGTVMPSKTNNLCSRWDFSSGGACLLQTRFLDDCSGLRMALDEQARRMRAAQLAQQSACATGAMQCSDLTGASGSEANLYQALADRYRQCRYRSSIAYPFNGYRIWGSSSDFMSDSLWMGLDYH